MTYVATDPYADVTFGDAYVAAERLKTGPWDDATVAQRLTALREATNAIDRLNFTGHKYDGTWTNGVANQPRQFPRGLDTTVPLAIQKATVELAFTLLDDVDPDMEVEAVNVQSQGFGSVQTNKNTDIILEHVAAGIPSIRAWAFLTPFLRDPRILDVDRG